MQTAELTAIMERAGEGDIVDNYEARIVGEVGPIVAARFPQARHGDVITLDEYPQDGTISSGFYTFIFDQAKGVVVLDSNTLWSEDSSLPPRFVVLDPLTDCRFTPKHWADCNAGLSFAWFRPRPFLEEISRNMVAQLGDITEAVARFHRVGREPADEAFVRKLMPFASFTYAGDTYLLAPGENMDDNTELGESKGLLGYITKHADEPLFVWWETEKSSAAEFVLLFEAVTAGGR